MTTELMRVDGPAGLVWRLSVASVVDDGPFSIFPGIERSLTVISGPGFDLVGDTTMRAAPLVPIAFPGDVALAVRGVSAPCEDVNVLTARRLPRPEVTIEGPGACLAPGGLLCLFALEPAVVNDLEMGRHDLCLAQEEVAIGPGGRVLAARLYL
jgi:hypothetical protein